MSRTRALLQTAIVTSNPVFPFRHLNRLPYRLALHLFVRNCRSMPEIRGVYLRHGMAQGDWIPGISDIDLTVTVRKGLTLEEEFRVLTGFWRRQAGLRRWFPMLSDVLILSEDELDAWGRFGIWGYQMRDWNCLLGAPPACSYREAGLQKDALDDALYRYFDRLLAWYFEPHTELNCQRMRRVATRIFRHAPVELRTPEDPALLVARTLIGLERWIAQVEETGATAEGGAGAEESVIVHHDFYLVVPGLDGKEDRNEDREAALRQRLLQLREEAPKGKRVRFATRGLVQYWLRIWNPRQHQDWLTDSEIVLGKNVVREIGPPDEEAGIRSLLNSASLVLGFPQLEEVILQKRAAWFAGSAFHSMVERGCLLRMYLETGKQWLRHAHGLRAMRREHPAVEQELEEIRKLASAEGCDLVAIRLRAFRLLKENALAVRRALPAAVPAESALRAAKVGV